MGTLNGRGVSLGEAIVAIFLILSAVMVTITLFHSGLRYGRSTETRTMAALFGRKVMSQIRSWARDPAKFRGDWSDYQNQEFSDPDFPGFLARVRCSPLGTRAILSPSSELESMYAPRDYRLDRSIVAVSVSVVWGSPEQKFKLDSLVGEPDREAAPNVIINRASGSANPIPRDEEVTFGAELRDGGGAPIPDIRFSWTIHQITGNATLQPELSPRDGTRMKLIHRVRWFPLLDPPDFGHVPGEIKLQAVCRYRGKEIIGEIPVQLQ